MRASIPSPPFLFGASEQPFEPVQADRVLPDLRHEPEPLRACGASHSPMSTLFSGLFKPRVDATHCSRTCQVNAYAQKQRVEAKAVALRSRGIAIVGSSWLEARLVLGSGGLVDSIDCTSFQISLRVGIPGYRYGASHSRRSS